MADLYGTYDKRIKLTIDKDKIDATLTWIPITVLLTATAGEEVFVEFDADADFDKIAFTKADGSTQLYADCELFDDSAQKAIYHVSRDGWEIASGADTDFYMYYDNDASSNDTYISKSGGTAAQSVWDGNFKAVYHMHDVIVDYDTKYEAAIEPDSDGWALGGTDYASVSGGILTIDTIASDSYTCYYYKTPDVDFDAGFYLKTKIKASTDMDSHDDHLIIDIKDGTQDEDTYLKIYDGKIMWQYDGGVGTYTADTTTAYHIYEVYIKGTAAKIYVDGIERSSYTIHGALIDDLISFGDTVDDRRTKIEMDYLYYALETDYDPLTILDSTSNNNDGTKKGANEPVEVTGKVGQAQDFDYTDDYIGCGNVCDMADGNFTLEAVINPDVVNATQTIVAKQDDPSSAENDGYWLRVKSDATINFMTLKDETVTQATSTGTITAVDTYVAGRREGTTVKTFINGAEDGSTTDTVRDTTSTYPLTLGVRAETSQYFDGLIDEVRISDTNRSDAWIKGTYNSLWDTLLTYGSEETSEVEVDNAIFFGTNL